MGGYWTLIELDEAEASFHGLSWDMFGLDGELYLLQVGGLSLAGVELEALDSAGEFGDGQTGVQSRGVGCPSLAVFGASKTLFVVI